MAKDLYNMNSGARIIAHKRSFKERAKSFGKEYGATIAILVFFALMASIAFR